MGGYISSATGAYYEGDRAHVLDIGVPARPSPLHAWTGEAWATDPDRVREALSVAVQNKLDAEARAAGYDSIFTAVTYADEPAVAKFQNEGRAFRAWRSLVWAHSAEVLAEVQAGERDIPSAEEFLAELPALDLPEGI